MNKFPLGLGLGLMSRRIGNIVPPVAIDHTFGQDTLAGAGGVSVGIADGTYGEFTVSGGILSPNTSPLTTTGEQDVGGLNINVVANTYSKATGDSFSAILTDIGTAGGKTVEFRDGNHGDIGTISTAFTSTVTLRSENFTSNYIPVANRGGSATVEHFGINGAENLTIERLNLEVAQASPTTPNARQDIYTIEGAFDNVLIQRCKIGSTTPISKDHDGENWPTVSAIVGTVGGTNMTFVDNNVHDVQSGPAQRLANTTSGNQNTFRRNHFQGIYRSAMRFTAGSNVDISSNVIKEWFGNSGGRNLFHTGLIGWSCHAPGEVMENIKFNGNMLFDGDKRHSGSVLRLDGATGDGYFFNCQMVGNMLIGGRDNISLAIDDGIECVVAYNTMVPDFNGGITPNPTITGSTASLTAGSNVIDLSADSPDLSGVATDGTMTLSLTTPTAEPGFASRIINLITAVDNTAKTITCVFDAYATETVSWSISGNIINPGFYLRESIQERNVIANNITCGNATAHGFNSLGTWDDGDDNIALLATPDNTMLGKSSNGADALSPRLHEAFNGDGTASDAPFSNVSDPRTVFGVKTGAISETQGAAAFVTYPTDHETGPQDVTLGTIPSYGTYYTPPDAFGTGDWSLATGSAAAEIDVTVSALPADNGTAITAIQYRVDKGPWTNIGGATTGTYTLTMAAAATSYDIRLRAVGSGASPSSAAKTQTSANADVTAPTLSAATDSANGSTDMTGSVTTDEGNGTLYTVVSTSATTPSAAQIAAGQDHTGTGAPSTSQAVSGTGAQAVAVSGLTASTAYFAHYMHEDAAGNRSAPISADGFTTTGGAYTMTLFDNNGAAYLQRSGSDGNNTSVELSVWLTPQVLSGIQAIWDIRNGSYIRLSGDALAIKFEDGSGATTYLEGSSAGLLTVGTQAHLYVWADAATNTVETRIDGVVTGMATTLSAGDGLVSTALQTGLFATYNGGSQSDMIMGDMWIQYGAAQVGHATFYNGGTPPDISAVGTPYVHLGGNQTAANLDGYENLGSATLSAGATGWT